QEGEVSDDEQFEIPNKVPRVPSFKSKDGTVWKQHYPPKAVRTRQCNIVTHLPGVKPCAREAKTPIECWSLFFDDDTLNVILENTNLYINKCSKNYSRERSAKPTDIIEIKALIGLLYLGGVLKSARLCTDELWDRNGCGVERTTCVGTVRKNKRELPKEFVETKRRPVGSSIFGFQEDTTIVSFVPKKGKNVILASSMHHDDTIDSSTGDKNKPEIVTFYNSTKGGVDVVDKLCAAYDVARNTRRWPMVILYALLNIAGINSQVIYIFNNQMKNSVRRMYLKELAIGLTVDHLKRRAALTNLPREVREKRQEVAGTLFQHIKADQFPVGTRKRVRSSRNIDPNQEDLRTTHLENQRKRIQRRNWLNDCPKLRLLGHANLSSTYVKRFMYRLLPPGTALFVILNVWKLSIPNVVVYINKNIVSQRHDLKMAGEPVNVIECALQKLIEVTDESKTLKNVLKEDIRKSVRFLPDLSVKKFKVVIRGLDQKIDPHMIQQDLADLGFRALRVVLMHSFRTRLPLPMFLVELEDGAAARDVLNLKSLLYFKVVVEDYRGRKLPPQCSRCQQYFHTAGSCRAPPSCRQCASKHLTKDCAVSRDTPPVCVNCNGPHRANYRGCPHYKALLAKKDGATRPPKPPQKAPPQPRPSASVSASRTSMRTLHPAPAQKPGPPPPAPKVRAPEEAPTQSTFAQVTARGTKRVKQSQQARVTDAPPPPKEQRPDRPRREGRTSRRGENLKPLSPPKSQVKKAATSSRSNPPSAREPGRPGTRCLCFKCPAHDSAPCVNPHESWETEQFVRLLQGINPQLTFRALMNGLTEMTRRLNARPSLSTFPGAVRSSCSNQQEGVNKHRRDYMLATVITKCTEISVAALKDSKTQRRDKFTSRLSEARIKVIKVSPSLLQRYQSVTRMDS
ncbi:hypothetical protein C0J52_18913, partial [Blattella germanica]